MTEAAEPFQPVSLKLKAEDPLAFSKALGDSFRRFGFGVVSDHGLNPDLIEKGYQAAETFFALPPETKKRYHIEGGGGQRGYVPFGKEIAKGNDKIDLKEFWHIGRDLPAGHKLETIMPPNLDVAEITDWHKDTYALYNALDDLGGQILSSIAVYLGIEENWFAEATRDGNSILRLLHYPAQTTPPPEGSVRAAAHGDINAITLLLGAEEGGLEVQDRDGRWLPINPPENCIVINMGDMLERLTNHYLPSTQHRVVNPKPERSGYARYSMPFFLHFRPDFIVRTLENCVSADSPNKYPTPITAHAFLEERLKDINLI